MVQLTAHDDQILKALFDPESSGDGFIKPSSTSEQSLPGLPEPQFAVIAVEERTILQSLNSAAPTPSEIQETVLKLSDLINTYPTYASAYVNRAQARRMLIPSDSLFSKQENAQASEEVLRDLDQSISAATPVSISVSPTPHQCQILGTAHTHRGLLMLMIADKVRCGSKVYGLGHVLQKIDDAEEFEELANKDFFTGGQYGNQTARQLAVKTNPYAKMCSAIVKEAIHREIESFDLLN